MAIEAATGVAVEVAMATAVEGEIVAAVAAVTAEAAEIVAEAVATAATGDDNHFFKKASSVEEAFLFYSHPHFHNRILRVHRPLIVNFEIGNVRPLTAHFRSMR